MSSLFSTPLFNLRPLPLPLRSTPTLHRYPVLPKPRRLTTTTVVSSFTLHNLCPPLPVTAPLISAGDHWGTWSFLFAAGAFGIWAEKRTKIGETISGAIASTLAGLAASNLGLVPSEAPAYQVVFDYFLPLAIPLLLFNADLRRIVRSTGDLLLTFLLGYFATIVGTLVAFALVPMRSLGQDSWKIAAALMSSYIGGTINFVAVSEALGISPAVLAAGLATDNVLCAVYFMILFALAAKVSPEASKSVNDMGSLCITKFRNLF